MSLDGDLLDQAERLAGMDPTRPKQASLRRAISTAYYALFHLLIREACTQLVTGPELRALTARAFDHKAMKHACQEFTKQQLSPRLRAVAGATTPPDLQHVAETFIKLQQARHEADYNLDRSFSRAETRRFLRQARDGFEAWARVRGQPVAQLFLAGLLLGERWNRG
ncbi:MAG: hypothetical protein JWO38_5450 [Gemmataceae bacterium]|nr:hypothetical protein [Gemmataceae bacterium]